MKNLILLFTVLTFYVSSAQVYKGKGDTKLQVGTNLQRYGTGINGSFDKGIGENISIGISGSYALGIPSSMMDNPAPFEDLDARFIDRLDIKARFNANLANVIKIENLDIYPGLNISFKNFGGHLGGRYFFTSGFGVFTEVNIPFSTFNTDKLLPREKLHNQFSVNIGASFNI